MTFIAEMSKHHIAGQFEPGRLIVRANAKIGILDKIADRCRGGGGERSGIIRADRSYTNDPTNENADSKQMRSGYRALGSARGRAALVAERVGAHGPRKSLAG